MSETLTLHVKLSCQHCAQELSGETSLEDGFHKSRKWLLESVRMDAEACLWVQDEVRRWICGRCRVALAEGRPLELEKEQLSATKRAKAYVLAHPEGVPTTEVAAHIGKNTTITYGLLNTVARHSGAVTRNRERNLWFPSTAPEALAAGMSVSFTDQAEEYVRVHPGATTRAVAEFTGRSANTMYGILFSLSMRRQTVTRRDGGWYPVRTDETSTPSQES